MAAPQVFHTVGHLYRSIEHGFQRLVERHGEAQVFIGPDHPGELAGPAFTMVDPSQFVLPYRQAAWRVMVRRLGEIGDACARLGLQPGLGRIAELEPKVRTIPLLTPATLCASPGSIAVVGALIDLGDRMKPV